jgi:rod shape-determining protein MreC
VGVAVKAQDGWRVALDTDAGSIDLVRILLFRDFSQLVGPLQPGALPSTSTDAPPPPAAPAATAAPSTARPAPKAQ